MKEFNINLITLNYNDADTTINFVKQILNYKTIDHIVVVDNQSTDDSFKKIGEITNNKIVLISNFIVIFSIWLLYILLSIILFKDLMISQNGIAYIINSFVLSFRFYIIDTI